MKILVLSDIHEKKGIIAKLVGKFKPNSVFFLGDGLDVLENELAHFPSEQVFKVKGNCDTESVVPATLTITLLGHKFLLTHGHSFEVKQGMIELFEYAKKEKANVVCFGHTHKVFNESINSIKFFNPGSLGDNRLEENTFGIIEIEAEKITFKIEKI